MGTLGRCLVLDVTGAPCEVTSCEEAIWDIMVGNAILIEPTGELCHSQNLDVDIPSVIQQLKWHKQKNPSGKPRSLPLTPRNVAARDRWVCAYRRPGICTGRATTIDHVHPRSKGGAHVWENVVASCRDCNHAKGNKSLADLGWEILTTPWRPTGALARVLVHMGSRDEWTKYLS